jgi:hypothetical protein
MRSFEACLHLQEDYVYLQYKAASSMVQLWKLLQWSFPRCVTTFAQLSLWQPKLYFRLI